MGAGCVCVCLSQSLVVPGRECEWVQVACVSVSVSITKSAVPGREQGQARALSLNRMA